MDAGPIRKGRHMDKSTKVGEATVHACNCMCK